MVLTENSSQTFWPILRIEFGRTESKTNEKKRTKLIIITLNGDYYSPWMKW